MCPQSCPHGKAYKKEARKCLRIGQILVRAGEARKHLEVRPEIRLWRLPDPMPTKPTTNVGITTVPVGVVTSGPKVGQTTYVRVHLNADSQTLVVNGKAVRTRQVWFHRAAKPSNRAKIFERVGAEHKIWKARAMRAGRYNYLAWQVRETAKVWRRTVRPTPAEHR